MEPLPPGQRCSTASPTRPGNEEHFAAEQRRQRECSALTVGQRELGRDGRVERSPDGRTERPEVVLIVADERHAKPFGDGRHIEQPILSPHTRREDTRVALAQAFGLGDPTSTCREGIGVDSESIQDHRCKLPAYSARRADR